MNLPITPGCLAQIVEPIRWGTIVQVHDKAPYGIFKLPNGLNCNNRSGETLWVVESLGRPFVVRTEADEAGRRAFRRSAFAYVRESWLRPLPGDPAQDCEPVAREVEKC